MGIQTGESLFSARQKCNHLLIVPSNHELYRNYSNKLYQLFTEYTDKIERFSIDECFLDMTDAIKTRQELRKIAEEINKRVKEHFKFTVNVGISTNKLLAKMASDFEKPDKIHTLYPEEIQEKMWKLPASELFMVGRRSIPKLQRMGITTIGDIATYDKRILIKNFGKFGLTIWEYANGIDKSEVCYEPEEPKGIGNSITLPFDIYDIEKLYEILLTLVEKVAYRLRKEKMKADTITVHIRTKNFKNYSHSKKMKSKTDSSKVIYEEAKELLKELHKEEAVRLLGVRVEGLSSGKEAQISLFNEQIDKKQEKIDKVMDELKEKYGYFKITKAGEINSNKWM